MAMGFLGEARALGMSSSMPDQGRCPLARLRAVLRAVIESVKMHVFVELRAWGG